MAKFWQEDIECMPLERLAKLQEDKLNQSAVLTRAYASALYRERWQRAGVNPALVHRRAGLKAIPFLTGTDLKRAWERYAIEALVDTGNIRLWFSTSGTTGAPKWIPYGDNDLSLFEQIVLRDFYTCRVYEVEPRFLLLTSAAPFIADGAAHMSIFAEILNDIHFEHIVAVPTAVKDCLELSHARQVDALFAFPSIALRVAEKLSQGIEEEVVRRFKRSKSLTSLAALLLTKTRGIKARDIFRCKYGLFSGEALAPYRKAINEAYGLEPFELYTFTEFPCFNIECPEHSGIHLWLDTGIAEFIPQAELDKEESNQSYVPEALFLDEAKEGAVGEYVITTFGQALPLVRYRTSDLIQIVGTAPCGCGRTHPRIKVLRRLDDVVNMGLIRFSILELEERLGSKNGIKRWQLRLERDGYKPRPVLIIDTDKASGCELASEIKARLFEIEILRMGCEAGIVAQPEIKFAKIDEQTTATGKVKRIVYADNW